MSTLPLAVGHCGRQSCGGKLNEGHFCILSVNLITKGLLNSSGSYIGGWIKNLTTEQATGKAFM